MKLKTMGKKHQKNKHLCLPAAFTYSKTHQHANTTSSSSLPPPGASSKTSLSVTEKLSLMRQDDAAREAKARKERQKERMMRLRERQCKIGARYGREEGSSIGEGALDEMVGSGDDHDDDDYDDIKDELAVLDLNAATMPSVPPEIRKVLNLGEVPVLSGHGRKRRTGHRRVENDSGGHGQGHRRAPPGPPPPKSWVTGDQSRSVMAGGGRGRTKQKRSCKGLHGNLNRLGGGGRSLAGSSRPRCYFGLESQDPTSPAFRDLYDKHHHASEKLSCMVARQMARYWDELLEMEQYNLATLPARLKALLLGNIILYGPDAITIRTLQVLFLNRSELEDATGAEELTELDLSTLVGYGGSHGKGMSLKGIMQKVILCRRIREEDEVFPVLLTSSTNPEIKSKGREALHQNDTTPDSWDAEDNGINNGNSISIHRPLTTTRFTDLTRLSLAHPQFRYSNRSSSSSSSSFSSTLPPSNHWSDLLALTKHLPTLTHLSLAHWPIPTLTPNSHTAYVSINPRHAGGATPGLSSTSIPHGGTHFYSAMDDDWTEAVGILRRLSANTYCLQYLDLEGCVDWWLALVWPRAKHGRESGTEVLSDAALADCSAYIENNTSNGKSNSDFATTTATATTSTKTAGIDWTGPWRQLHTLKLSSRTGASSRNSLSYTSTFDSDTSYSPGFKARTLQGDHEAGAIGAADPVSTMVVQEINSRRRAAGLGRVKQYLARDW